jgi:hypothetical protein
MTGAHEHAVWMFEVTQEAPQEQLIPDARTVQGHVQDFAAIIQEPVQEFVAVVLDLSRYGAEEVAWLDATRVCS